MSEPVVRRRSRRDLLDLPAIGLRLLTLELAAWLRLDLGQTTALTALGLDVATLPDTLKDLGARCQRAAVASRRADVDVQVARERARDQVAALVGALTRLRDTARFHARRDPALVELNAVANAVTARGLRSASAPATLTLVAAVRRELGLLGPEAARLVAAPGAEVEALAERLDSVLVDVAATLRTRAARAAEARALREETVRAVREVRAAWRLASRLTPGGLLRLPLQEAHWAVPRRRRAR